MPNQRIGNCVFEWNPDRMTPPEQMKAASSVKTYSGSAIFQWDAVLEGTEVGLEWDWMPESQYLELRSKYLSPNSWEWNPQIRGQSYAVIIKSLQGEYFETVLNEKPYRRNVKMVLEIRSTMSTTTTTTTSSTTSSSTTTTTTT